MVSLPEDQDEYPTFTAGPGVPADELHSAMTYAEKPSYPYLTVTVGAEQGRDFVLRGRTRLGRERNNEVILDDPKVSRHHAVIDLFDWGCTLTDLNSTNGTFVNGVRITGGHQLIEGDEIALGGVRLVYHQPFAAVEPPYPSIGPSVTAPPSEQAPAPQVPPAALVPPAQVTGRGSMSIWVWGLLGLAVIMAIVIILGATGSFLLYFLRHQRPSPTTVILITEPPQPTPTTVVLMTETPQPTAALPLASPTVTATQPAATAIPSPEIISVEMSQEVDAEEKAIKPTNVFGPEDAIYCSVQATGLRDSILAAKWYAGDELIHESDPRQGLNGSRYVSFEVGLTGSERPLGDYKVEIYLNGERKAETDFSVVGVSTLPFELPEGTYPGAFDWEDYVSEASWETYTRRELGFSIDHPHGWVVEPAGDYVLFFMKETGVAVYVMPVPDWEGTTEELATMFFEVIKESYPDTERAYSEPSVVENGWAIGFSFTYKDELKIQAEVWGLLWEKGGGLAAFLTPAGEWEGALPVFARMGLSLQSLGETKLGVEETPVPLSTPEPPVAAVREGKIVYTKYATGKKEENRRQLWIMNLDGSDQRMLADWASKPSFSPDGKYVAFYGWEGIEGANGIHVVSVDGQEHYKVLDDGAARYVEWSPDGESIAFSAQRAQRTEIFIRNLDDKTERYLVDGKEPGWSPDGQRLVHWSCKGNNCGLFITNVDGSGKTLLTDSANDSAPVWSPDGGKIAFISDRDGNWEIYTINPDGSGLTRLTDNPGHDAHPAWLPDSSGLVFHSYDDGLWSIWIMKADGSDQRKISDTQLSHEWQYDTLDVAP